MATQRTQDGKPQHPTLRHSAHEEKEQDADDGKAGNDQSHYQRHEGNPAPIPRRPARQTEEQSSVAQLADLDFMGQVERHDGLDVANTVALFQVFTILFAFQGRMLPWARILAQSS
jgi:hypothetical protein